MTRRKYTTLEPTEKPKNARMKCDVKGFCWLMQRFFTEPNRKGINAVFLFNMSTGTERVVGAAFKQTEQDKGTMLNFCPMCGESLEPMLQRKSKPPKKARAGAV